MNPSIKGAILGILIAIFLIGLALLCNSCSWMDVEKQNAKYSVNPYIKTSEEQIINSP